MIQKLNSWDRQRADGTPYRTTARQLHVLGCISAEESTAASSNNIVEMLGSKYQLRCSYYTGTLRAQGLIIGKSKTFGHWFLWYRTELGNRVIENWLEYPGKVWLEKRDLPINRKHKRSFEALVQKRKLEEINEIVRAEYRQNRRLEKHLDKPFVPSIPRTPLQLAADAIVGGEGVPRTPLQLAADAIGEGKGAVSLVPDNAPLPIERPADLLAQFQTLLSAASQPNLTALLLVRAQFEDLQMKMSLMDECMVRLGETIAKLEK